MYDLSGRVGLVTGGGGGIGREIARRLAGEGMAVTVLDRDAAAARAAAAEINGLGVIADVTAEDEVSRAVETAIKRFGRIDLLVNNAGICWTGPALDMPLATLRAMLAVNVEGVFIVSRAVLPHMITRRSRAKWPPTTSASTRSVRGSWSRPPCVERSKPSSDITGCPRRPSARSRSRWGAFRFPPMSQRRQPFSPRMKRVILPANRSTCPAGC